MDNSEKKCREIGKQKGLLIRKNKDYITVHYEVTITRQSKSFHTWEDVLKFVENYER